MTTIVSRLFADAKTADQAANALMLQGHPGKNITIIAPGADAAAHMAEARVPDASAEAYAGAMSGANRLLVVMAPVTPFGAARNAIMTMDEFDAIDAGVANENYYIAEEPRRDMFYDFKVDRTHRYWATWGHSRPRGRFSDAMSWPTVYSGTKYWGSPFGHPLKGAGKHWGTFVGTPLTGAGKYWGTFAGSPVIRGTKYFGSFLMKPISRREPRVNVS